MQWGASEALASTLPSRKALGDFSLTARIEGYWDRRDVEIDLVAIDERARRIRFATCKRSADKLKSDLVRFRGHVATDASTS